MGKTLVWRAEGDRSEKGTRNYATGDVLRVVNDSLKLGGAMVDPQKPPAVAVKYRVDKLPAKGRSAAPGITVTRDGIGIDFAGKVPSAPVTIDLADFKGRHILSYTNYRAEKLLIPGGILPAGRYVVTVAWDGQRHQAALAVKR